MTIPRLSLLLLSHPRQGVKQALVNPPTLRRLLVFLGVVGLLRGALEAVWLYAMARQPGILFQLLQDPGRYLLEGTLFVAANVMTAYLRWAMYAFLFLGVARWFGRPVAFKELRTLAGLMMGLYLVPVAVNTLYLILPLPVIKFSVTPVYQPVIGLGQLVGMAWFGWVGFHLFRQGCRLSGWEAFLGALFIPLLDRALFVGGAAAVFQWRWLAWLPVTARMGLVTIGFIAVALVAVPLLLWLGRRVGHETIRP